MGQRHPRFATFSADVILHFSLLKPFSTVFLEHCSLYFYNSCFPGEQCYPSLLSFALVLFQLWIVIAWALGCTDANRLG